MGRRSTRALALLPLLLLAAPSPAATITGVGVDYVTGPLAQSTRDVMAFAVTSWGRHDLTLALARFDHSDLGAGTIGSTAFSFPISHTNSFQLLGARTVGDESYRAWLFQAGPVFDVGGNRTLSFLYTRAGNSLGPGSTGLSSELGIPLSTVVHMTGRGSLASADGGGTTFQGAVGMIWGLSKRLVFVGEAGTGRDVTSLAQGAAGAPLQPGVAGTTDYVSGSALQVGLRYIVH